jgi:hypothetical protein
VPRSRERAAHMDDPASLPTNSNSKGSVLRTLAVVTSSVRTPETHGSSSAHKPPTQLHRGATRATVALVPSPYPAARIAVDANRWRQFRQAALVRGIPVSVYLARLVETELGRRDTSPLADLPADAGPRDEAFAALAVVRASIDELDDIAGKLARAAVEVGGSWRDIATRLRLTEDAARRAYEHPRSS